MEISNLRVYDISASIVDSGFPMLSKPYSKEEYETEILNYRLSRHKDNPHFQRACKLGRMTGGHDCFLKGILVRCHVTMSLVMLKQWERYTFSDIVSSMSTMHRITHMDITNSCNTHVHPEIIKIINDMVKLYNEEIDKKEKELIFADIVYSAPAGLELTMSVTSNYLQEKNIIKQRKNHKLAEWREYCAFMIKNLPNFSELTGVQNVARS